jgi:hypothetical protein
MPVRVIVPVDDVPPTTEVGLTVIVSSFVARTDRVCVRFTPVAVAPITAVVSVATGEVTALND